MGNVVKIVYQKQPKELSITCNGRNFDVSGIADKSLEQWVFPFYSDGERWNGLYEELRDFVGNDDFTIQFDGDDASFEILKYVLKYDPVELEKITQSVVTIMYSEDPFDTKITVDGKPFDVTRIQNRSIDEWMNVIDIRGMHWDGIFNELNAYLDSESYTIYFVGDQEFMNMLIEECPSTVSIFYRDPQVARLANSSGGNQRSRKTFNTERNSANSNANNITDDVKDTIKKYQEQLKNIQNEQFQFANESTSGLSSVIAPLSIILIVGSIIVIALTLFIGGSMENSHPNICVLLTSFSGYCLLWLLLYVSTVVYTALYKYPVVQKYLKQFSALVIVLLYWSLYRRFLFSITDAISYHESAYTIYEITNFIYLFIIIYTVIWALLLHTRMDAFVKPLALIYANQKNEPSEEEYEDWKKEHEAKVQEAADKLNQAYKNADNQGGNNGS